MREVFQFRFFKNWKALDFGFFVGNVIIGVDLCIFGRGHQGLGTNAKSQFFD